MNHSILHLHQGIYDLVLIFGVSAIVVYIFARLKQPPIAGYLLSGVLIGEHGLNLVSSQESIHQLAELGLVFLLFSVGVEFSFKQLIRIRKIFFYIGGLQVFVTTWTVTCVVYVFLGNFIQSAVTGFIVSLSSTAIVLKLMHERREMNTSYGDLTVGTLLFQDIIAIPVLILIPYLNHFSKDSAIVFSFSSFALVLFKGIVLLFGIYLGARFVIPKILDKIAETRVRELFIITIGLLTLGCAIAGEALGLSLAMGAFIAGLMVSESRYGHQVVADLVPLKEPFIALFFVSVGLLLDGYYFTHHFVKILSLAFSVFILKYGIAATLSRLYKLNARTSSLFAINISQIGEFSFVVAGSALAAQIVDSNQYQLILAVIVITMLISPSIIRAAPLISPSLVNLDPFKNLESSQTPLRSESQSQYDHVIIIGYGMNGQNLTNSLRDFNIMYSIIETNAQTVESAKKRGEIAIFGDASRPEILSAAGIYSARLVVIAINDVNWISKVVHAVRELRPDIFLVVRCTYLRDAQLVSAFNINELVIGEELTAKELLNRVFIGFGLDTEEARETVTHTNISQLSSTYEKI